MLAWGLGLAGCGSGDGGTGVGTAPLSNPTPSITSTSPNSGSVGEGSFTLTVTGTGFISDSVVRWNGGNRTTTFVSSTQLEASISASDVASAGTAQITVFKPSPGGGISNALTFTVTRVFSNTAMKGEYAFSIRGINGAGAFLIAGILNADGNGNLTGIEDLNDSTGVHPNLSISGTYSIGSDGRGNATITSSQGTSNFRFVMISNEKAMIIQFDTFAMARGVIEKRSASTFADSDLNGGYAFLFNGVSSNGLISIAGRFTANGAGGISSAVEDVNDSGIVTTEVAFTGTYSVTSNGRGTAIFTSSLGTSQFSFYFVSPSKVRFVSLDFVLALIGIAERQQSSGFSDASLFGDYAFLGSGQRTITSSPRDLSAVGRFSADGFGGIDAGVVDENDMGEIRDALLSGIYNISSNGRAKVTFSASPLLQSGEPDAFPFSSDSDFAVYMVSSKRAFFVGIESFALISGTIEAQQEGPFSTRSLGGNCGFLLFVGDLLRTPLAIVGQFAMDGGGNVTGIEDVNVAGIVGSNLVGTLSQGDSRSGTYTIESNGRGLVRFSGSPAGSAEWRIYVVSPSQANILGTGGNVAIVGMAEKRE